MFRKGINTTLLVLLSLAIIFSSTSCQKLKVSRLRANYHFSKANNFYEDSLFRKAIEEYELALEQNPKLVQAYQFLGESYKSLFKSGVNTPENMEKANKALEALAKAYEIEPDNKMVIHSLGDMYDMLGNFEEAEKLFLKIVDMEPTNMENYYVAANFYRRYAGQTELGSAGKSPSEKAKQMYLRRIELDPENPQGYAYAADFYVRLSPPDLDLSNYFQELRVKLEPDNAITWYTLGVNRFFNAHRLQFVLPREDREMLAKGSEKALLKAIELDPTYADSYAYMKVLYINVHARLYPERAKRYIEEAEIYGERFQEAQKRALERRKLEAELKKSESRSPLER